MSKDRLRQNHSSSGKLREPVDALWDKITIDLNLIGAKILQQKSVCRVYLRHEYVYKVCLRNIVSRQPAHVPCSKTEFEILSLCQGIEGVVEPIGYQQTDHYEVVITRFVYGTRLSRLDVTALTLIRILYRVSITVMSLTLKKIAHNDLSPGNIIIAGDSLTPYLIDFSDAQKTSFADALLRNFFIERRIDKGRSFPLVGAAFRKSQALLPPRARSLLLAISRRKPYQVPDKGS